MVLDMEKYVAQISKYKTEAMEILKKLISFPSVLDTYRENSVIPFGKANHDVLNYILDYAKKDGFVVCNTDEYAGHIEFGKGKETLGILGHLDVVPVNKEEWQSDPFTLNLRNGKLYGRGVMDDKGPVAAVYIALKILKDNGFEPQKRIRLILGCDEESGSRCLQRYFQKEKKPEIAFSPDADFPLIYGEKGMISYDIFHDISDSVLEEFHAGLRYNIVPSTAKMRLKKDLRKEYRDFLNRKKYSGDIIEDMYVAYGVAAHAMCPEKGQNAICILFEFLKECTDSVLADFMDRYFLWDTKGEKLGYQAFDEEMKSLTSNLAVAEYQNGHFKIGVNCRVPLDEHFVVIKRCLDQMKRQSGFSYTILSQRPRHYVNPRGFLVQTLWKCYQKCTKDYESKPMTIGGGTYAGELTNAVAFGPLFVGREDVCHIANEYMLEEDFYKLIEIYLCAIYELSKV